MKTIRKTSFISKRVLKQFVLSLLVTVLLSYCKKKEEEIPQQQQNNNPTITQYTSLADFYDKNKAASQYFTINSGSGGTFTGSKGTKITFAPNSFVNSFNQSFTGSIKLELKEVYSKKDIILSNISTMSYGQLLISGGMYYLKATMDSTGEELFPVSAYTATLPVSDSTSVSDSMMVFTGVTDTTKSATTTWTAVWDSSNWVYYNPAIASYVMSCDNFHWINCDYFWNISPTTSVTVTTSNNPSYPNSVVDIVFSGKTIGNLNQFNQQFTINGMPVGYNATIVAIAINGGKIYSSFTPVTITNSMVIDVTLSETTEEALKNQLNAL